MSARTGRQRKSRQAAGDGKKRSAAATVAHGTVAAAAPAASDAQKILNLQRTVGNAAVQHFLSGDTQRRGGFSTAVIPAQVSRREEASGASGGAPAAIVPPAARPTLSQGARGVWVTTLQNKLRASGVGIDVDGIFGALTRAAVLRFQESSRIAPDAVVGRRTWEALDAVARGGALSDADVAALEATFSAGLAAMDANDFSGAIDQFGAIYRDPRLATKPRMLAGTIFNLAGCYHHLAVQETRADARDTLKERAIALYQEHDALPGLEDDRVAAGAIRIRECRMSLAPTPFAELEGAKNDMNPGGAAVAAGERPTLAAGSRSAWVTTLQNKLRAAGYGIAISGVFDAETRSNVVRFQESSRIAPDGVVGRRTWEALDAVARGGALSDADMAALEATFSAGLAAMDANDFSGAIDQFGVIYRDPRLATKPRMLAGTIFNLAGCYHHLAVQETRTDARDTLKERAIALYQEHDAIPGLEDDRVAAGAIRIRECRMSLAPTPFAELEGAKNDMNPGGAATAAGERPTLAAGSRSAWVTTLQNKLRAAGYGMTINGVFDAETRSNVVRFQESSRIAPDGVVGRRTWEALDAVARGGALSDADMTELEATFSAGLAAMDANDFAAAIDQFGAIYRDPRLATKPRMLAGTIFNLAGCYHHLTVRETTADARATLRERAIGLYQEHDAIPGLEDDRVAAGAIRIRECRMSLAPTPFADLERDMHGMNPAAA